MRHQQPLAYSAPREAVKRASRLRERPIVPGRSAPHEGHKGGPAVGTAPRRARREVVDGHSGPRRFFVENVTLERAPPRDVQPDSTEVAVRQETLLVQPVLEWQEAMRRGSLSRIAILLTAFALAIAAARSPLLVEQRGQCECCGPGSERAACCARGPSDCGICVTTAPLATQPDLRVAEMPELSVTALRYDALRPIAPAGTIVARLGEAPWRADPAVEPWIPRGPPGFATP